MASPQKENGFTPISHEILEALATTKINGTQFRIILVVWRYTYGFNRKSHDISVNFLVNATGITKRQIQKELKSLIELGIILEVSNPSFNSTRIVSFNKDYEQWNDSGTDKQQVTKKTPQQVTKKTPQQVTKKTPQQVTKKTPKKESIKEISKESNVRLVFEHYVSKDIIQHKKILPSMRSAINSRLKDYTVEQLIQVIDNYTIIYKSDDYWFTQKYGLADLMRDKDVRKFVDEAEPLNNFLKDDKRPQQRRTDYKVLTEDNMFGDDED